MGCPGGGLSKKCTSAMVGKYLDWGSLKSIITLLNDPQMLDSLNDTADSIWTIARAIRIRDELRGSKVMPLSDIFCSALQISDQRDRILALQGISCSKSHLNLAFNDRTSARESYQKQRVTCFFINTWIVFYLWLAFAVRGLWKARHLGYQTGAQDA